MLVVVAIILIITGVIITSHSSFNKTFIVNNTAYDIALSLRNAEIYGIGSRASNNASSIVFNTGYGLEFAAATTGSYTFFADIYPGPGAAGACYPLPAGGATSPDAKPGNCIYDPSQSELVTTYTLGNSMKVSNYCAYRGPGKYCASLGTAGALDIVFARPNAAAKITILSQSGGTVKAQNLDSACITVSSPEGVTRGVEVTALGQVSLPTTCP